MLRGETIPFTRENGFNPPRAKARRSGVRVVSHARIANRLNEADDYNRIHANPSEHIELYQIPFEGPGKDLNSFRLAQYDRHSLEAINEIMKYQNLSLTGELNKSIVTPRPGETRSSPRVKIMNFLLDNRPMNYTGFRYGSNYAKAHFDIDSAGFYDNSMYDRFPELIENHPIVAPDYETDFLDDMTKQMERDGEFRWQNLRESEFVRRRNNRLRPGDFHSLNRNRPM